MTDLVLDPTRSRVRIQTFAEGFLARLAHDLELMCSNLSGTATSDGTGGKASIAAPLDGFDVVGVLAKDGRVDEHGLTAIQRRDCIAKMQRDVFHTGPEGVVRIEAHLDSGSARVRLVPPKGKTVELVISPDVRDEGGATRAKGTLEISLMSIGSDVVSAPMNAFRVKDKVRVVFDVVFVQPA